MSHEAYRQVPPAGCETQIHAQASLILQSTSQYIHCKESEIIFHCSSLNIHHIVEHFEQNCRAK